MLPQVTLEGRVVADPELRFSPTGVAVGKFRMVCSSRKKNEQSGEWEDDKTLWMQVTCFKRLAENLVESVEKGDLILVTGRLQTDEWTTDQGEKRSQVVCLADAIGPSLQFRTVPHGAGKAERVTSPPPKDEFATAASSDEPPF